MGGAAVAGVVSCFTWTAEESLVVYLRQNIVEKLYQYVGIL